MIETENIEEALEKKFIAVFNSVSDAIFILDMKTLNIVDTNPAATKLYQYRYEELISLNISDLAVETDKNKHIFLPEDSTITPILYHLKKDGTIFPVKITSNSFSISNRPTNITVVRDISQQIKDDKEKRNLESQLHRAQKLQSIGTLTGGIAHDFNNILSSIIGFSELALDAVEKGSAEEDYLQEIYTAGRRAMDLVRQILTFARQTEEDIKPLPINAIIKESLKLIRSTIPTTIEIRESVESGSFIMGDPGQIHQIFMNLCTNAAYAMEDTGGIMYIGLTDIHVDYLLTDTLPNLKPGEYLKLSVSDSGTGIPSDILDSIFEPYFTTKKPGEATGMGLAIVHDIAKSYGGAVHVESSPNKKTVFDVYFPIVQKKHIETRYASTELPTGTEHILFVDDEPSIGKMASRVLKQLGYEVTALKNSVEALELFRSRSADFDLVITDMTMPNMTGDKLAMEMMRIKPDIPVIFCTGYSKKISDKVIHKLGVKAISYKPLLKKELAEIIRRVLDSDG